MVIVPATVRSKSGAFVTGLNSPDLELTDNGVKQTALVEQPLNQPLAVAVVMQTGAASHREFQNYRTLTALLGVTQSARASKVAFITFDSKPRQVWNFPTRLDGVQYAIDHLDAGDSGASILDAVAQGIDLLQQQPPNMRRILLLLSESQDTSSAIEPLPFLQRLGESNVAIYSIAFPIPNHNSSGNRNQSCLRAEDANPQTQALLRRLCTQTAAEIASISGGEHIEIKDPLDLGRSVTLLGDAFANGYVLSFHPTSPSQGLHILSVKAIQRQHSRLSTTSRAIYWVR